MTVTTMTKAETARPAPKLTCAWVPVRGRDGRTRMEMRWADESQPARRHASHAA